MAAETYKMSASAVIVTILLLVLLVGGGLVGCPYYKVWERKIAGQAELQYQQGARQALIAQAAAEDEAAIKRAEAATRPLPTAGSDSRRGGLRLCGALRADRQRRRGRRTERAGQEVAATACGRVLLARFLVFVAHA